MNTDPPRYNPRYKHLTVYCNLTCNMACPLCHQRKHAHKGYRADPQTVAAVLYRFRLDNVLLRTVTVSGGEPLCYSQLEEMIAVVRASRVADTIQVITNGIGSDDRLLQLRMADVIRVTDYGAANRYYIHRLRSMYGGKVHVSPAVHVPVPIEPGSETVSCQLRHIGLFGRRIYPCCTQALHDENGIDIGDVAGRIHQLLDSWEPTTSPRCVHCLGNKIAYLKVAVPPTFQSSVWGVEESSLIVHMPWLKLGPLYKLYSRLRAWRGR